MRVHQVLAGAGRVDAVTAQAAAYGRLFADWGVQGGVHAAAVEPGTPGVAPLERLAPVADDLVLFHWSAWDPRLEPLLELPQRKALVYHNVTPADLLWRDQPHLALQCLMGRERLPAWVAAMDVVCAVSEYNAAELREAGAAEVHVVPILFERAREGVASCNGTRRVPLHDATPSVSPSAGPSPHVLSVGRLAPHKRPDLVLRAFGMCSQRSLLMVGSPLSAAYLQQLRESAPPGVTFTGAVSDAELRDAYAGASVVLSMSEHEGFWIPLLEAFDFGVPVVARPVGGMPWVGGDAVLWADTDDLAVVAELVDIAAGDAELREEVRRRGEVRLEEFDPGRTAAKLRAALGLP